MHQFGYGLSHDGQIPCRSETELNPGMTPFWGSSSSSSGSRRRLGGRSLGVRGTCALRTALISASVLFILRHLYTREDGHKERLRQHAISLVDKSTVPRELNPMSSNLQAATPQINGETVRSLEPPPLFTAAAVAGACQSTLNAAVSADWSPEFGLSLDSAVPALRTACSCMRAEGAIAPSQSITAPLLWWTEARQSAFISWYRLTFLPGRGTREPNASVLVRSRDLRTRLSIHPIVLDAPGRLATEGGILISGLVDLSQAFAAQLDAGDACSLLLDCAADATGAVSAACGRLGRSLGLGANVDAEAVWAPGFAVRSVAPLHSVFPALVRRDAMMGGGSDSPTGSGVWDAVSLRAQECEATAAAAVLAAAFAAAGAAASVPSPRPPPLFLPWMSYACLLDAQDEITNDIMGLSSRASTSTLTKGITVLSNTAATGSNTQCDENNGEISGGGGGVNTGACDNEQLDGRGDENGGGGGGANSINGHVEHYHRLWHRSRIHSLYDGAHRLPTLSGTAVRDRITSEAGVDFRPWSPPRVAALVDVSVHMDTETIFIMRGSRYPQGDGGLPRDVLAINDCIWNANIPEYPLLPLNPKWVKKFSNVNIQAPGAPPIPKLAILKHSLAVFGNYFHAFSEGLQPLWALRDYGDAAGAGLTFGIHGYRQQYFLDPVGAVGLTHVPMPMPLPWSTNSSGGSGAQRGVPIVTPVTITADGSFRAESLLIVDGPTCSWPGVLTSLLAREVLRRAVGLRPVDMTAFAPANLRRGRRRRRRTDNNNAAEAATMPLSSSEEAGMSVAGTASMCHPHGRPPPPSSTTTTSTTTTTVPMSLAAVRDFGCPSTLYRPPRLLFVHRNFTRQLTEEADLKNALAALGGTPIVDVYDDAALPNHTETWRLFGTADAVFAPHGAALANLLASRPGTAVFEFSHSKQKYFGYLSGMMGLEWHYWEGPSGKSAAPVHADVRNVSAAYCGFLARTLSEEACAEAVAAVPS